MRPTNLPPSLVPHAATCPPPAATPPAHDDGIDAGELGEDGQQAGHERHGQVVPLEQVPPALQADSPQRCLQPGPQHQESDRHARVHAPPGARPGVPRAPAAPTRRPPGAPHRRCRPAQRLPPRCLAACAAPAAPPRAAPCSRVPDRARAETALVRAGPPAPASSQCSSRHFPPSPSFPLPLPPLHRSMRYDGDSGSTRPPTQRMKAGRAIKPSPSRQPHSAMYCNA